MSGHGPKLMDVQPSRFQWHKFKDMLHFYVMLGAIPITGLLFYLNVFVGPAQLTETPEDYVPKHWEYHRVSSNNDLFENTIITIVFFKS
jgi:NADH dehydrogenase (ubiquinone) 1 beta subcomplex subunit 5